jgi:hypothetical protein
MNTSLFEKLHEAGLLTDTSLQKIRSAQSRRLFSLHWELKTILYTGVLLLSSGLGILTYKNIDSIGHQAVLLFILLLSAGGFWYCFKTKPPFSTERVASPNAFFDYGLLLACLCFIIFIGYWQYQYHVFGDRFGLVTFLPMLVLFFSAYFFDHLGALSLAITNLAAWAGIAVTPAKLLKMYDINSSSIILTGLVLGIGLIITSIITCRKKIKSHFAFTYTNFGMHILFVSILAGMFDIDRTYLLWFAALAGGSLYFYKEALRTKSFYILLILTLYAFIGLSYVVLHLLFDTAHFEMGSLQAAFLYFILAGLGLVLFLIRMNKKIKTK